MSATVPGRRMAPDALQQPYPLTGMPAFPPWMKPQGPVRIGVSSCLLGEPVRWDGGHKHDPFITGTLGQWFEFVAVCPEAEVGLGVPRPPIRLTGNAEDPRAEVVANPGNKRPGDDYPAHDPTESLRAFGRRQGRDLAGLSGYLLKKGSPSCGMERVPVYPPEGGTPVRKGVGLYAAEIMAALPLLPVEEEGRLNDPGLRDNFIERVFAYRRWRALLNHGLTPARLVDFHNRHTLALMAHGAEPARRLGRLVADAGNRPRGELAREYGTIFMALLKRKATRRTHASTLHHLMGTLKQALDAQDKSELAKAIEVYRQGRIPLIVPLTLLRHHCRRYPHPHANGQTYLNPEPAETALRGGL